MRIVAVTLFHEDILTGVALAFVIGVAALIPIGIVVVALERRRKPVLPPARGIHGAAGEVDSFTKGASPPSYAPPST